MARTTLNIATPVLDEVKRVQKEEGSSLGQVVTRLLSQALAEREHPSDDSTQLSWISKPMKATVDLADREAVYALLDEEDPAAR